MTFKKGQVTNPNGSRRERLIYQAFVMELKSAGEDLPELRQIARKCIEQSKDGNAQAREFLADRLEGKVPQAVTGVEGEPLTVHHSIVRRIITPDLELLSADVEPIEPEKPRMLLRQAKDII